MFGVGISKGLNRFHRICESKALLCFVFKPPCLDFSWNSPIIISYVIEIVQVLTDRCKSKFKTEN